MPSFYTRAFQSALAASCLFLTVHPAGAQQLGDVFYILMENHNLTQPNPFGSSPEQILGNPAAPYLNSLMTPGNANAAQTSWASNYHNVAPGVHPSEPNYIWGEGGSNYGTNNDNDPNPTPGTVNNLNHQNLSGLLQAKGISWKAYAEDSQLVAANVTAATAGIGPIHSGSGNNGPVNPYYNTKQWNYAVKHVGQLFYSDTNGTNGVNEASHYAPLSQLQTDLANNTVARYTQITPNQYDDAHSALTGGFTYNGTHYTGDQSSIAQGDNFLSIIVPEIMNSNAYKNNGAIVIWWDETEGGDSNSYTLPEIVISPLAKGNAYDSTVSYTHSSDLKSMQELFDVYGSGADTPYGNGLLRDAGNPNTNNLSDLFKPNVIVPEPSQFATLGLGVFGMAGLFLKARKRRQNA
jgi:hypothetical protein